MLKHLLVLLLFLHITYAGFRVRRRRRSCGAVNGGWSGNKGQSPNNNLGPCFLNCCKIGGGGDPKTTQNCDFKNCKNYGKKNKQKKTLRFLCRIGFLGHNVLGYLKTSEYSLTKTQMWIPWWDWALLLGF